ncbi:exodeoxyribonuclease V subunit beta [Psychrosphaera sp. B3R10]|uniref:exodeoxyribonuclease V subunit beta n=1 Tax=unclassified Psychrosphaera TaxID=2641570 RepID=UPI001C08189C|nr:MULTISPECIES: exodeoxyribonuclease V subunit beta [unclassified Psychrosphaera]MBU2882226.1 exodeoxyribonuclease V subunit beta [Psychrosphaera sp. I2R16]MBU2988907.1 exodeoxyribonuclease V subunit beta [Psychrosphaera sp. B3R10]
MNVLNPLSLVLNQNCLIEASAGTGKTYTITTLYLRAILGLIDPERELSPIEIQKILVVTFTDAATKELKDRIRDKLIEAQHYLISSQSSEKTKADPNLIAVISLYQLKCQQQYDMASEAASLRAYTQLQQAIVLIDEASIFTIHGYCQRCLNQFAFETQSDFDKEMDLDSKPTTDKALYDFWRREVLTLTSIEFGLFSENWATPEALYNNISNVLGKRILINPTLDEEGYQSQLATLVGLTEKIRTLWNDCNFSDIILSSGMIAKRKAVTRLASLEPFLAGDIAYPEFTDKDRWSVWGQEVFGKQSNYKKGHPCLEHEIIALIEQLIALDESFCGSAFKGYWLTHAKNSIERLASQSNSQQQTITPDDLLTSLANALENDEQHALVKVIRNSYPLAFIDEFQDTDPVQYQIFSTIYKTDFEPEREAGESAANMILIGDPKQAIYKFRGADIYTYIRAKHDIVPERHFTLNKNWRSHPELIQSVNYIFEHSPEQFEHKSIPFVSVDSGRSFDSQQAPIDHDQAAFEVCHLVVDEQQDSGNSETNINNTDDTAIINAEEAKDKNKNKSTSSTKEGDKTTIASTQGYDLMAKWCAVDIVNLLNGHKHKGPDDPKAVSTGDICILVRSRPQAKIIKNSLSQLGLDSVYLSRDSIFSSKVAQDLNLLLVAIAAPNNEQKVKTALATQLFQYSVEDLLTFQHDPNLWQEKLNWFFEAQVELQRGNITSSVEHLMFCAESYSKWSSRVNDFNRHVTDLRHLLEILQTQQKQHAGIEKLLLWFEQQISMDVSNESNDEKVLRLESDSNLIKIVTYHASKGLEYPYVYLPFICNAMLSKQAIYTSEKDNTTYFRADNRLIELQYAEQERMAEDIRLLYVSLTRPIYRVVIGMFNVVNRQFKLHQTAIYKLLFGREEQSNIDERISDYFTAMSKQVTNNQTAGVVYKKVTVSEVHDAFKSSPVLLMPKNSDEASMVFNHYNPPKKHDWRIISYSMMSNQIGHASHSDVIKSEPDVLFETRGVNETEESESNDILVAPEGVFNQFHFPKGANAGTCIHWILEHVDFQQPMSAQTQVIIDGLTKFSISLEWVETVEQWLQNVILNPKAGFSLSQLAPNKFINELEFYFDFSGLDMSIFGNALSMLGLEQLSNKMKGSMFSVSRGVVKGFVDVVVQHEEKFYVVDYKSNFLGFELQDYDQTKLFESMIDHHYHLQALIYLLALHRFLATRLTDYNYDLHIGGAVYLYVRGMDEKDDTGVYKFEVNYDVIQYLDNALKQHDVAQHDLAQNADTGESKSAGTDVKIVDEGLWSQKGFGF